MFNLRLNDSNVPIESMIIKPLNKTSNSNFIKPSSGLSILLFDYTLLELHLLPTMETVCVILLR